MQDTLTPEQLARLRGDYGFDAPTIAVIIGTVGLVFLLLTIIFLVGPHWPVPAVICFISGAFLFLTVTNYIYTTRKGKFQIWAGLLTQLNLRGDEQILDMGCGRGAVLLMAAKLLTTGKITGIDLWLTRDQSGNAIEVTRHNAELEGVAQKVELATGDMRDLPFADKSFDVLLSSLAIHNIANKNERLKAIDEADTSTQTRWSTHDCRPQPSQSICATSAGTGHG